MFVWAPCEDGMPSRTPPSAPLQPASFVLALLLVAALLPVSQASAPIYLRCRTKEVPRATSVLCRRLVSFVSWK
jgi:hypothetical protein